MCDNLSGLEKGGAMNSLKAVGIRVSMACALFASANAWTDDPAPQPAEPSKKVVTITRDSTPEMRYKLIPLETIDFATVESVCRPWLSQGGLMTYEKPRASVLVYDVPAVIAKVEKFVRDADLPPVNVKIDVDYMGAGQNSDANFKVGAKGSFNNPNVRINARNQNGSTSDLNSMSVVAGNGLPATLWVGKTMVDPSWLRAQRLSPYAAIVGTPGGVVVLPELPGDFAMADVGCKLMAIPFYQEATGNITLDLFPVVSFLDGKGKRQAVKVESLSTRVVVRDGVRMYLGGAISSHSEDYSKIFGGRGNVYSSGSKSSGSALDIYVTCHAMKLDDPRMRSSRPATPSRSDYENPMDNFKH